MDLETSRVVPHEIVLLNANTTEALTERMVVAARRVADEDIAFRGVTAPFGHPYISSREGAQVAAEAVDAMAGTLKAAAVPPAALIIACFGDPGLWRARAALPFPVLGMAEASCHVACQVGQRFSIVTGGRAWGPMLEEFVDQIGLSSRLGSVRTLELTGDAVARDPEAAASVIALEIAAAASQDNADVVILGGAGLVGMAARLRDRSELPLLDSLACLVAQATALVRLRNRD